MEDSATLLTLRIPDFEAAIRKAAEPRLAARPVAIVTSFRPQGRILAACPTARDAGIAEEMHYSAARQMCPDAAFFVPDRRLAEQAFEAVWKRALAYSPQIEAVGNGCVLLETRGTEKLWGDSLQAAAKAQKDIRERLRLPVAAGLAARLPWSVLASRAAGDCGIRQVAPGCEDSFLDTVPVGWIDGITAKTRMRLMEMNIRTAGQLRPFGHEEILHQFGSGCGDALWNVLHPPAWRVGTAGESAIVADDAIRAEAFLAEATAEMEKARLTTRALAGQIAAALRKQGLGAARLRLTLLHADGVMKSAVSFVGGFVQDETVLADIAHQLVQRIFKRRVRFTRLWLAAEKLSAPERQGVLFSAAMDKDCEGAPCMESEKSNALTHTLDRIRSRYGDDMVTSAALMRAAAHVALPESRHVS